MPSDSLHQIHQNLKIGEIARLSGLSVKTVRYYEDRGLLVPNVIRTATGYRLFDSQVLQRLAFIKRAQSLGLSLTAVKTILAVHDRGELPCPEVKHYLQEHLDRVDQQLQELHQLRSQLQELLSHWQEHPPADQAARTICPNLQSAL